MTWWREPAQGVTRTLTAVLESVVLPLPNSPLPLPPQHEADGPVPMQVPNHPALIDVTPVTPDRANGVE